MAANELAAQGVMPSNLNIRAQLGNRGSESTIQKYLKEWKHELLVMHGTRCTKCSDYCKQVEELKLVLLHVRATMKQYLIEDGKLNAPNETM